MPIYSYKCTKCGNIFEKMEKVSSNGKITRCDICDSEAARIFSPVGIIFKGSGFYSTDYKSSGSKKSSSTNNNNTQKTKDSTDNAKLPKSDKDTTKSEKENK